MLSSKSLKFSCFRKGTYLPVLSLTTTGTVTRVASILRVAPSPGSSLGSAFGAGTVGVAGAAGASGDGSELFDPLRGSTVLGLDLLRLRPDCACPGLRPRAPSPHIISGHT